MRKFVLAGVALFFTVGLVLAAEVTFVSYDKEKKELTVKNKDDKETTYKVSETVTFKATIKGEEREVPFEKGVARLEKMEEGGKAKGKAKLDVETDTAKKSLKEIKFKVGKKKPQ